MRKSRKTIGIDAEYAELLKNIARKRGMSIASYLRRLIDEAVKVEELGYFAPRALSEKKAEILLSKLGFTYTIPDLLKNEIGDDELLTRGLNMGRALIELGVDPVEVVELIGISNQLIATQGENIIILPQHEDYKRKLSTLLKGIAKGAGLSVVESGEVAIIQPFKKMV
ncbi:MAG: CopG family transcriptional regulator [Desulfurococcaceae archaeon]